MVNDKFLIFISHASPDANVALSFRQMFEDSSESLTDGSNHPVKHLLKVYVSTGPDTIALGTDWFKDVLDAMDQANVFVVLMTKNSIQRHWVWFEVGYIWNRWKRGDNVLIIPLFDPTITLPHPLSTLQGAKLDNPNRMLSFAEKIGERFGDFVASL
ncbi:MAG: TIR domain-containing protein [Anaerolineaceae bacterium]|nr:TIR domain-containing protein [Anaerolineaceae bacterium]